MNFGCKMKNNLPGSHHRHSLRLKGYDYTCDGMCFITIRTKEGRHWFGEVSNGKMILDEPGRIAELFLAEVQMHFLNAKVVVHVVMPNHVHLILELRGTRETGVSPQPPGDDPVGTRHGVSLPPTIGDPVGTCHGMSLQMGASEHPPENAMSPVVSPGDRRFGKPIPGSVSVIISQYKSSVKRWCNKNGHDYFQWQSRFYDHIIRNEESRRNIVDYIIQNPGQWERDTFY